MADIHDFMAASGATDDALRSIGTLAAQLEDGEREPNVALAVLLAADAIALAIREVGVRHDYVVRDERRR